MSKAFTIVDWQDNAVVILDQRRLPTEETYLRLTSVAEMADAITTLAVRGAPAIGVTAVFGIALVVSRSLAFDFKTLWTEIESAAKVLQATRPTAVNLTWGLDRMKSALRDLQDLPILEIKSRAVRIAIAIKDEDIATNRKIGAHGQVLLQDGDTVLTHCNAGALATAGYGTALGVIYTAIENGKTIRVIADETRPLLQGARLTAWELKKNGVPVTVITDNMAASLMQAGHITKVIVGADRIAANGDTANKIGTYGLAVLAQYHKIPFYVVAPFSTVDLTIATGQSIPIEERGITEVSHIGSQHIVPSGIAIRNPAFDVTPSRLISAIVTEHGVIAPPFANGLSVAVHNTTHKKLA